MTKLTQDEQELYKILNDFRQSSIIISAKGSVLGVDEDVRAFKQSIADAEQAILALKELWQLQAENRVIEVAHKPCECRGDHLATPVRSVTGVITSYCQFSRVHLSSSSTSSNKDNG